MASFFEMMFFIQFFVALGIMGYKAYNLMNFNREYRWPMAVLLFVGFLIAWFLGLVIMLYNAETSIYVTLFQFETYLLYGNVFIFIIEIIFIFTSFVKKPVKPFNAREARGLN